MDYIINLPVEIAQKLLLLLGNEDLENLWNGMEEWRHVMSDSFWRKVCLRNDFQENEDCLSSNIYRQSMSKCSLHWRAIIEYNYTLEVNWRTDQFKCISTTPEKKYMDINYFDDEILVASRICYQNIVMDVIDVPTGKIFLSFYQAQLVQKTVKYNNQLIFFYDTSVRMLNFDTRAWMLHVKFKMPRSFNSTLQVEIVNNLLVFVESTGFLHIINLDTKVICFQDSHIASFTFDDDIIILLSNSGNDIRVLDFNCTTVMNIHYGEDLEIEDVMAKGGFIIIYYKKLPDQNFQKVIAYTIRRDTRSLQEFSSIKLSYQFKCLLNKGNSIVFLNCRRKNRCRYCIWKFAVGNRTVNIVFQPH